MRGVRRAGGRDGVGDLGAAEAEPEEEGRADEFADHGDEVGALRVRQEGDLLVRGGVGHGEDGAVRVVGVVVGGFHAGVHVLAVRRRMGFGRR